jgi:S1-C subfamily serine protease
LVGINTAIASRSGGYQGIGFAIPSLMAKEIMGSLLEHGSVKRGWLGVSIQALTPNLARQFGLGEESHGVLVSEVLEGTPAEKAGLRSGDVVLALDGEEMRSPAELRNEIAARGAGKRVQLAVQRDGARQSFAVKLGLLPDGDGPVGKRSTSPAKGPLGLELRAVDDSTRSRLGLAPRLKGVLVSAVDPGSAGDLAGLRAGDIIIDANHRRVASVDAFRKAVNRSKREILIRFKRGRGTLFAIVRRAG